MHQSTEKSLRRCSLCFGLLAVMTAGLVGLGNESWNLPLLAGIAVIAGYIYTDWLQWFSMHRFLVYLLMVAGAVVAVAQFVGNMGSNRLIAVGNLLVYVQLPLIFQRKSKRVFEQWGVFLLLELVVAALVNDNVLYGLLMLPVLSVGCAAMLHLAIFGAQSRHSESQSESLSSWARLLHWLGRESKASKRHSGIGLKAMESLDSLMHSGKHYFALGGRTISIPIVIGVLLFSAGYFYSLPRLQVGAYEANSWFSAKVGFSEQVSLRYQGEIRQNETPVFRMQMFNERKKLEYRPNQPPYIRLTALHRYYDGPNRGIWQKGDSAVVLDSRIFRDVPKPHELQNSLVEESDPVVISIVEKTPLGEPMAIVPPFSYNSDSSDLVVTRRDWRLLDSSEENRTKSQKRRYTFRSYGFLRGSERVLLPELSDCVRDKSEDSPESIPGLRLYRHEELTDFPESLEPILPLRDAILKDSGIDPNNKVALALYLEQHLSSNPSFQYSLRSTPPVNPRLDPIADFLLNKKKGHCEYYASSLAMLLRSLKIPTRVISGFRPGDYNDLGGYFTVQQKHAHVWVEAYFTIAQLESIQRREPIPPWVQHGMWMRLDPTPGGEGSNARGDYTSASGQTLGVMQDLWSEMILNMDKTRQGNMFSIFAETSEGSYAEFLSDMSDWISSLQSSRLIGGIASPQNWFSWRAAIGIILLGTVSILAYRVSLTAFPQWTPRLRGESRTKSRSTKIEFFNRLIKALKKLGYERSRWETPREFFLNVSESLREQSIPIDGALLADSFYQLRFNPGAPLAPQEMSRVEEILSRLEAAKKRK